MGADWIHSLNWQTFLHWITGDVSTGSSYILSRWIFLRLLGVVYLIAFISLWVQIKGLIGSEGILPFSEYLSALKAHFGSSRFTQVPTVFWLSSSDAMLHIVCALGVASAVSLIIGFAPLPSALILWVLYLSLLNVSRDFLSFQWDILLIEVGLLAILFAPSNLLPNLARETAVLPIALFLIWWLAFRFMFESGVVKLNSGDKSWLDMTAFTYHYFTQPLPSWTAWYLHHAPMWFHKISGLFMYAVELVLPFFIFFGKVPRVVAFLGYTLLMIIITLTGNYNFFTLLTVVLAVPLVPDVFWLKVLPSGLVQWLGYPGVHPLIAQPFAWGVAIIALVIVLVSSGQLARTIARGAPVPLLIDKLDSAIDPLRSVNAYGLFRVMTKTRPEIVIEGSNDANEWKEYVFKYKPGDLGRAPPFNNPHQPRLDWQMWFAALSSFERTSWFQSFMVKILEGNKDVLGLMKHNPFPEAPPKYIRALLYHYEFTEPKTKKATGLWWRRVEKGMYSPVLSL